MSLAGPPVFKSHRGHYSVGETTGPLSAPGDVSHHAVGISILPRIADHTIFLIAAASLGRFCAFDVCGSFRKLRQRLVGRFLFGKVRLQQRHSLF
jgi:hypothetical protein